MKKLWKVLNKSNRSKNSSLQLQCIKAGFSSIEDRIIFGQNTFSDMSFYQFKDQKSTRPHMSFQNRGFVNSLMLMLALKNKPRIVIHLTPNMLYHRALVERLYELDRAIKDFAFQDLLDSENNLSTQNLCLSLPWRYNRLSERKHARVRGEGLSLKSKLFRFKCICILAQFSLAEENSKFVLKVHFPKILCKPLFLNYAKHI